MADLTSRSSSAKVVFDRMQPALDRNDFVGSSLLASLNRQDR